MKKYQMFYLMLIVLVIQSCSHYSGYENVPKPVITAFELKFPETNNVAWSLNSEGDWQAKFSVFHQGYSAFFHEDGEWVETDHKIITSAVPANVKLSLYDNYHDYEIEDAFIAEKQNGTFYEMAIITHGHQLDVEADTHGTLTSEKKHL